MDYQVVEDEKVIKVLNQPKIQQKYLQKQGQFIHSNAQHQYQTMENVINRTNKPMMSLKQYQQINNFDIHKIPADWKLAEQHHQAQKLGTYITNLQQQQFCSCCYKITDKQQIGLLTANNELGQIGCGYQLLFDQLKLVIMIGSLILFTNGLLNLSINYFSNYCGSLQKLKLKHNHKSINMKCGSNYFDILITNVKMNSSQLIIVQNVVGICSILILILAIEQFSKQVRETEVNYQDHHKTAANYSVMLEYIPTGLKDYDYIDHINTNVQQKGFSLQSISMLFDLQYLQQKQKELETLVHKKAKSIEYVEKLNIIPKEYLSEYEGLKISPQQHLEYVQRQIYDLKDQISLFHRQADNCINNKFIGKAILTFQTENIRNLFLEKYRVKGILDRLFAKRGTLGQQEIESGSMEIHDKWVIINQKVCQVGLVHDPMDLQWTNIAVEVYSKFVARCFVVFVLVVFILLSAIMISNSLVYQQFIRGVDVSSRINSKINSKISKYILYLNKMNNKLNNSSNMNNSIIYHSLDIGCLTALLIIIINQFSQQVFRWLSRIEKWSRYTLQQQSIASKLQYLNIMNYTITPLMILHFAIQNHNNTLQHNQLILIVMDIVILLVIGLINPTYQTKRLYRWLVKGRIYVSQQQANRLYNDPQFQIYDGYFVAIYWLYFMVVYVTMVPLLAVLLPISVTLYYWITKYNLLRRSATVDWIGADICKQQITLLRVAVLLYTISNYIMMEPDCFLIKSGVLISIVYVVMPMECINQCLLGTSKNMEILPYNDVELEFQSDYMRMNPAISATSIKQFITKYN